MRKPDQDVRDWTEFEHQLEVLRQDEVSEKRTVDFLFRGLGDSDWPLATTLERAGREGMAMSEYYHTVSRANPEIRALQGPHGESGPRRK
jgi:hypothetical protein